MSIKNEFVYDCKFRFMPYRAYMNDETNLMMVDGTLSIKAKSGNDAFRRAEILAEKLAQTVQGEYVEIYDLRESTDYNIEYK